MLMGIQPTVEILPDEAFAPARHHVHSLWIGDPFATKWRLIMTGVATHCNEEKTASNGRRRVDISINHVLSVQR